MRLGRDRKSGHRRDRNRYQCKSDSRWSCGIRLQCQRQCDLGNGLRPRYRGERARQCALGQGATSSGNASTAVGFAARAFGNDSVAVGDTATAGSADVNFSTAIGSNTSANFASSTALGFGAQTTAANQMMFGTATNIYALPGVNSAASRAAQQPPLMMLTVDAAGNIATAPIPTCRCPRPPVKPKPRRS